MVPSSWAENNNSPALTSQTALGDSVFVLLVRGIPIQTS
jgi:hypothetical protein